VIRARVLPKIRLVRMWIIYANSEISFSSLRILYATVYHRIQRDQINATRRLKIALTLDLHNKFAKLRLLLSLIAYRARCHESRRDSVAEAFEIEWRAGIAAFRSRYSTFHDLRTDSTFAWPRAFQQPRKRSVVHWSTGRAKGSLPGPFLRDPVPYRGVASVGAFDPSKRTA